MGSAEGWVFLDGQYKQQAHAVLPVADRGFQFGDGVFTTVRVSYGRAELLSSHLERLYRHAEIVGFSIPEINVSSIERLIALNDAKQGIWRLKIIATASEEKGERCLGHLLMTLAPYSWQPFRPARLAPFPHSVERPLAEVKSLSYLDYLYAEQHALQQGADEALLCGRGGVILETNRSNIFWIDESICFIPDERLPYLKGVFLQHLKTLIPFPLKFIEATLDAVSQTASLFLCNSMTHLRPVLSIGEFTFRQNTEIERVLKRCLENAFTPPFF